MQPNAPPLSLGIPFAGLLLSMAIIPIVAPRFWQRKMGLVAIAWSLALFASQATTEGPTIAAASAWRALLLDYVPFITMLLALYTAGGGVLLRGGPAGTPVGNTATLALGLFAGSIMGTTGAAMVLINPLLHANAHRQRKFHLVLFMIVLVGNASITPLGNPPLYIGLLHGVPFIWPLTHLVMPLLVLAGTLLAAFYLIDRRLAASEPPPPQKQPFRVRGWWNLGLVLAVVLVILFEGAVETPSLVLLGQAVDVDEFAGDLLLIVITIVSVWLTPRAIRQANDFTWHPMIEVAILFAAIFLTVAPVEAMLRAGLNGPLAPLLELTQDGGGRPMPLAYFGLTGILSAFLDNAPTYLVFFQLAGLDPSALTHMDTQVLTAISAGAVFFGGLTYIGNAPNLMLRGIAAHRGVRMPGFFGFMLLAAAVLAPVLLVVGLVFFA